MLKRIIMLAVAFALGLPAIGSAQPEAEEGKHSVIAAETSPDMTMPEMVQKIAELERQVAALQTSLNALTQRMSEVTVDETAMRQIVGDMFLNPVTRDAFGRAVQGKIIIQNYRGVPTEVYINGTRWSAIPNRSFVYVPVGRVSIQQRRYYDRPAEMRELSDWQVQPDGSLAMTYEILQ